ncbi:MAG: hypothetical protein C4555_04490 [Dehalococcoidia bacterium]|nr:MAG: hypothetical protein C4555_04490 [Dehalococcoidia bacterium]
MSADLEKCSDDGLITTYLQIRDQVESIKESHKRELEPYGRVLAAIDAEMTARLQAREAKGTRGTAGHAYLEELTSFTINDRELFYDWVIDNGRFDWLTSHVSKDGIKAWREENPGKPLPSFVSSSSILKTKFVRARNT